jgi:hypothetical protein
MTRLIVGWVELIRAFTPVFAGYAKPIRGGAAGAAEDGFREELNPSCNEPRGWPGRQVAYYLHFGRTNSVFLNEINHGYSGRHGVSAD